MTNSKIKRRLNILEQEIADLMQDGRERTVGDMEYTITGQVGNAANALARKGVLSRRIHDGLHIYQLESQKGQERAQWL